MTSSVKAKHRNAANKQAYILNLLTIKYVCFKLFSVCYLTLNNKLHTQLIDILFQSIIL